MRLAYLIVLILSMSLLLSLNKNYDKSAFATGMDFYGTYALCVCGVDLADDTEFNPTVPIVREADYMYNTLNQMQYYLPDIALFELSYLTQNGSMNGFATHDSVLQWVNTHALQLGIYDTLFLFLEGHGGGAKADGTLEGGREDLDGDERLEHHDADYRWFGVDECFKLMPEMNDPGTWEYIWDDELALALLPAVCHIVVVINSCKDINNMNSTLSCFSGGFIDDLSGQRRIIITSSNETGTSWFADAELRIGFIWHFIDGVAWGMSWREAFNFAFEADEFRRWIIPDTGGQIINLETPWYDDDGDDLPNFCSGSDYLDYDDGAFGSSVYPLSIYGILIGDINFDGVVTIKDATPLGIYWHMSNRKYDINNDGIIDIFDATLLALYWMQT